MLQFSFYSFCWLFITSVWKPISNLVGHIKTWTRLGVRLCFVLCISCQFYLWNFISLPFKLPRHLLHWRVLSYFPMFSLRFHNWHGSLHPFFIIILNLSFFFFSSINTIFLLFFAYQHSLQISLLIDFSAYISFSFMFILHFLPLVILAILRHMLVAFKMVEWLTQCWRTFSWSFSK